MGQYLFYALSLVTVLSALMVVFAKSPMYSVIAMIVCFFSIAGHYVMLNAQFLAIVHVIVYAGAIMVLFLFVVMLLNLNTQPDQPQSKWMKIAAAISAGMLFLVLLVSLNTSDTGTFTLPASSDIGTVEHVGQKLFTEYVLPFEISSILLLSAMIGSVVLAKKEQR